MLPHRVCAALAKAGMITAAQWTDINNDGKPDLILAGEYMPIRFFTNTGSKLSEITANTGLQNINGMWRSLAAADIDGDGDTDFVAGNLGRIAGITSSPQYPMQLYAADIDGNGSIDPVMFYYIKDENGNRQLYPSISRDHLAEQVPAVKKSFLLNNDYASATAANIFTDKKNLQTYTCNETRSCWIENLGPGNFQCIHCRRKHSLHRLMPLFAPMPMEMASKTSCLPATSIGAK